MSVAMSQTDDTSLHHPRNDIFQYSKHKTFLLNHLTQYSLPAPYVSADANRLTLAFFCLHGLDVCRVMDSLPNSINYTEPNDASLSNLSLGSSSHKHDPEATWESEEWSMWIWQHFILYQDTALPNNSARGGFRPSFYAGGTFGSLYSCHPVHDVPHVTMTYTALASLAILSDTKRLQDIRLNHADAIITELAALQQSDGSFVPCKESLESDMRFLYCASAIIYMLGEQSWSQRKLDQESACSYIRASRTYEGAYGQGPMLEAHGGSTYCAIASLALMGRLDLELSPEQKEETVTWLLSRQGNRIVDDSHEPGGFTGRCNKPEDSCYSFWIGASLEILGSYEYVDQAKLQNFLSACASKYGGFSKTPVSSYPDLLHSSLTLSSLLLPQGQLFAPLGITKRAHASLLASINYSTS